MNLIATKYLKANTPLSSNGGHSIALRYEISKPIISWEWTYILKPNLSLSLSLSLRHILFKNKQNVEAEVFSTNVSTYQNVLVSYNNHFIPR